ncbi:2147_t:CDS:1, partial [Funneliformis mosseae]
KKRLENEKKHPKLSKKDLDILEEKLEELKEKIKASNFKCIR